ncbi:MAG: hypothetical protein NZ518_01460, partial [Dehalococcoidia bacterium]|nr:hypothetical protein [Dehalococcoidia bacterium]
GRNFLLLTQQKYDVIETDPILPTNAGAGVLYSADFYKLARRALKDDGLMVQWLNDTLPGPAYRMMLRAFLEAFPYATLWNDGTILVGSPQPIAVDLDDLQRRFEDPQVRDALATIGIRSAGDVLRTYTAGPDELRAFAGPGPFVSDHFPAVEYIRTIRFDGTNADPHWSRLAQHLTARWQPNDGVIFGGAVVQSSLLPHWRGERPEFVLPATVEGRERAVVGDVAAFVAGRDRVWFLPWWQSPADILVEHWLVSNAYLADDRTIAGRRVLLFSTAKGDLPQQPMSVRFGDWFELTRAGYDATPAQPGDIVRVALTWRARASIDEDVRTLVRLVDDRGRTLAASDRLPANATTEGVRAGQIIHDRVGVVIPPGTPPGVYRLLVDLYRVDGVARLPALDAPAQQLTLGELTVRPATRAMSAAAVEAATPLVVPFGAANLIGYTVLGGGREPGDLVPVTVYWQAQQRHAPGTARLVVGDPAAPVGETRLVMGWDDWDVGAIARVDGAVWISPSAPPGRYGLWLVVDGHGPLRLGGVRVVPRTVVAPPPPPALLVNARIGPDHVLVGATVRPTERGLTVDLVWEAEREQPASYAAFVHLVNDDGVIVAQSDQTPGGAPTNRWRAGERVGDRHTLASTTGTSLVIGLYDPVTLRRVGATTVALR